MAKNLKIDGVMATMNFNSGIEQYRMNQGSGIPIGTCCFCNMPLEWQFPPNPGDCVRGPCPNCGKTVEYMTFILSQELAEYFDVRGPVPERRLGIGAVMHIYLPEHHPEFDRLIQSIDPSISRREAYQPIQGRLPETEDFNQNLNHIMAEGIKKKYPLLYRRMTGQETFLDKVLDFVLGRFR